MPMPVDQGVNTLVSIKHNAFDVYSGTDASKSIEESLPSHHLIGIIRLPTREEGWTPNLREADYLRLGRSAHRVVFGIGQMNPLSNSFAKDKNAKKVSANSTPEHLHEQSVRNRQRQRYGRYQQNHLRHVSTPP
jgi:hypothetical protein